MFNQQTPTRSEGTRKSYEARYRTLKRRFCREAGVPDLDPNEVVAKLISLKPTLTRSSWRQYKAAVLHYIEAHTPEYEQAAERLREEASAGLRPSSRNTSGRKLKQVPVKAWGTIQATLRSRIANEHKHSQGLLHVLRATLMTGLRPNEWSFSRVDTHAATKRPILRVRNSKHTNGRGNGDYRELFLDELTPGERKEIDAALAYCAADNDTDAVRIKLALRDEFRETMKSGRATAPAWKLEHFDVTLYSFRHQFIADAKATFADPVLIAATVGHNSTATAFEHYGKRKNGRGRVRVTPTPETVEAVQKVRLETYRDYVAHRIGGLGPTGGAAQP